MSRTVAALPAFLIGTAAVVIVYASARHEPQQNLRAQSDRRRPALQGADGETVRRGAGHTDRDADVRPPTQLGVTAPDRRATSPSPAPHAGARKPALDELLKRIRRSCPENNGPLLRAAQDDTLPRRVRVIAASHLWSDALERQDVNALVSVARSARTQRLRRVALRAAAGAPAGWEALERLATQRDDETSREALRALPLAARPSNIDRVRLLAAGGDPDLRHAAIEGLLRSRDSEHFDVLVARMRDPVDRRVVLALLAKGGWRGARELVEGLDERNLTRPEADLLAAYRRKVRSAETRSKRWRVHRSRGER